MKIVCPRCKGELRCLSGESGMNSLNWRCENERECRWNPRTGGPAKVIGPKPQVRGW